MPKIKVLELTQFLATGHNIEDFTMEDFDPEKVKGGDSEAIRQIITAPWKRKMVQENEKPLKGFVWFKTGPDGKLKFWKANYDSSG